MDDWQLIRDYVERDSQTAFSTLVNRYLNLVYSVAIRQVQSPQLSEEVTQAVFLLLARKARGLRRGVVISGWLFRTTRFVASRAARAEQRRQRREQEAFVMQQLNSLDDAWKRISPVLDEALEHLGETDRNAVLLRYFNDHSHGETAAALGVSEDAAKKRVTRALEKLRHFFAARNVTLSLAVLGSAIAANAAKAATPEALVSVAGKIVVGSQAAAGTLPLVSQTLAAWRWAKLKMAGAVGIAVLTAVFLVHSVTTYQSSNRQLASTDEANSLLRTPAVAASNAGLAGQPAANPDEGNSMLFRVVDGQTEQGLANARIAVNYVAGSKWWAGQDLTTDAKGICRISIPGELTRLDVGVLTNGYVQKFYTWRTDYEVPLPSVYILKLERAVPIGGRVLSETGAAIAGAEIVMNFHEVSDSSGREPKPERLGFIRDLVAARTDAQGRWNCTVVPPDYDRFAFTASHPKFVAQRVMIAEVEQSLNGPPRVTMRELWASNAVVILRRGFEAAGVVLDDSGQPAAGAKVSVFAGHGFPEERATTKSNGAFYLGGLAAGATRIEAAATGYAPVSQVVAVTANMSNLVFRLERGLNISIRVVDEAGEGIGSAWVTADPPARTSADWQVRTDASGWAVIDGIPDTIRSNLRFHAGAKGFFMSRDVRVDLSTSEPRIRLYRSLRVSGRVVDGASGEVINSFKAIPSLGAGNYDRSERKFGTNGTFTVTFSEFRTPFQVRIEADGYEPAVSPPIPFEPREASIEIKLQRPDPQKAIRGMVLLPNGQPAHDAEVALLTIDRGATLYRGRFSRQNDYSILTRTDLEGRFRFSQEASAHTIVVAHPQGFGRVRVEEGQTVAVRLSPWGRIVGQVRTRDRQWINRDIALTSHYGENGFSVSDAAKTDAEGNFSLDTMPAGDYTLYLNPGTGRAFTDATPAEVRAGETTTAQIGGAGATVTGRLEFVASFVLDWVKQTKSCSLQPKSEPPPGPYLALEITDPVEKRKRLDLVESDTWRAWARSQRPPAALKIAADGSFIAEGLRAGEYTLRVDLAAGSEDSGEDIIRSMMRPTIASVKQTVTISAAQEEAGETLDLGAVRLEAAAQNPNASEVRAAR